MRAGEAQGTTEVLGSTTPVTGGRVEGLVEQEPRRKRLCTGGRSSERLWARPHATKRAWVRGRARQE